MDQQATDGDSKLGASVQQRGEASRDRSQMEKDKEWDSAKYEKYSKIIHCPHGTAPDCSCVKD